MVKGNVLNASGVFSVKHDAVLSPAKDVAEGHVPDAPKTRVLAALHGSQGDGLSLSPPERLCKGPRLNGQIREQEVFHAALIPEHQGDAAIRVRNRAAPDNDVAEGSLAFRAKFYGSTGGNDGAV